jgi:hypothetical protein
MQSLTKIWDWLPKMGFRRAQTRAWYLKLALAGLHKDIPPLVASSIINLPIHEALNEPAG